MEIFILLSLPSILLPFREFRLTKWLCNDPCLCRGPDIPEKVLVDLGNTERYSAMKEDFAL